MRRKTWGNLFAFPLQKRKWKQIPSWTLKGRTLRGGVLGTFWKFTEPLLRTLLRTLFLICETHSRPPYGAIRLRVGYGFASCDANGAKRLKPKPCETKRRLLSLMAVRNWSWRCLNEGNFTLQFVWHRNASIRVPKEHQGDGRRRGETFAMRNCKRRATAKHATKIVIRGHVLSGTETLRFRKR